MKSIREQYQQQVRRILRRVKAMQERGYEVPETIVPKAPKRITSASVRRLKKITPSTIAQKSTYHGELSYGAEIAGGKAYKQELEESRRKAQETRRRRKEEQEKRDQFQKELEDARRKDEEDRRKRYEEQKRRREEQEEFERERRKKDREEQRRMKDDKEFRRKFEQAKISWERLDEVIRHTGMYNPVAEAEMREHLTVEMDRRGVNSILFTIQENQGELTRIASAIVRYTPGSTEYESLMNDFDKLIGHIRSAEEKRADDDRLDQSESIEPLE